MINTTAKQLVLLPLEITAGSVTHTRFPSRLLGSVTIIQLLISMIATDRVVPTPSPTPETLIRVPPASGPNVGKNSCTRGETIRRGLYVAFLVSPRLLLMNRVRTE